MSEFRQELFLGLFNLHYGEDQVTLDDLINKTRLAEAKLNDDEIQLEDIRDGDYGGIELHEAVEKLAFELQNDRDLYRAYENKLSYVIYNRLDEEEGIEIKDTDMASEFAQSVAKEFLDSYINSALRTKEKNEEYKEQQMPTELNID